MDKLQFLDLTDLDANDEEQLNSILFSSECLDAVELPQESQPTWMQHPVPYQVEPVNGGEGLGEVDRQHLDYNTGSPMMAPHTVQYTQMPPPSVYVSNVTANVNVHGYVPQTVAYPAPVPFIPAVDPQSRKPRPAKSPTKRSPEVRSPQATNYTSPFSQPFTTIHYPPHMYYPMMPPRSFVGMPTVQSVFPPPAPPVFSPAATFPPAMFPTPHHVQPPPSEPREENNVPFIEDEEEKEPQEFVEQEQPEEIPPIENISLQPTVEEIIPVVEIKTEEVKVEKPLATKAPPANAFKSAPNPTQKPPFPQPASKPKRASIDGPEFVDPPIETGPPKKSYASLFGTGGRSQSQASQQESSPKPLAMIHPTVHNNVNSVSPLNQPVNTPEKFNSAPPVQENNTSFANSLKPRSEKIMPNQKDMDYDINLQRLGEFLSEYQLDHRPLQLQPRGLTNRSNYCYINAILQALIACPPFYNLMKAIPPSQENKNGKSRTPIIDSMVKFVNEFIPMSLNTRPVGRREKIQATKDGAAGAAAEVVTGPAFEPAYVYKMLSAMHAAFPVEGRQEDAEEFLSCLLNGLNDEMLEAMKLTEPQSNGLTNGDVTTNGDSATNGDCEPEQDHEWTEVVNKNNKSVVTRRAEFGKTPLSAIFRGQMRSRVIRAGIENVTTDNIQPFFTLQLDVEKSSSVEKALEQLVGKEQVVGGTCPKTNQEISMFTQTSLEELPLILLLHLKCFDYKLHTCSKIIKTVEFPVDLKIDNKLCTSKSKVPKDRQYKLLAVVYHDGKEATKGHYITDVFHTGYSGWVRYDDATVRPVAQHQVLNPRPPRVPYLLYYRRCDTIGVQDKNR